VSDGKQRAVVGNGTASLAASIAGAAGSSDRLVRRPSGIVVDRKLGDLPEHGKAQPVTRDADGRRRVVFTDDERRKLNAVIKFVGREGFGIILGCRREHLNDGTPACGGVMVPVGFEDGGPDAGYACGCSRIHWAAK
jgi:hypothetical protein